MVARAVHFALSDEQTSRLMGTPGVDNDFLVAFIEDLKKGPNGEGWDAEWVQETDEAWNAIHHCLTDGKLEWGDTPFHKCILGAKNLYLGDSTIMGFLSPEEVNEVAAAIKNIDCGELRCRYVAIDIESYGHLSDDDFGYTWRWFRHLRDFFQKAAVANRAMLSVVC